MSDVNGQIPVFKITINRESGDDMGSCEKFIITPENFMLRPEPGQAISSIANSPPAPFTTISAQYSKCAVPSCNNYFDGTRTEFAGVSHFSFPKDPELRKEWMTIINPPSHLDMKTAKVCSAHFLKADMYSIDSGVKALRPEALPRKKLGSKDSLRVMVPPNTGSVVVNADSIPSADISWSDSTQDQGEFLPKITSVQSMSTVVTRILNSDSIFRGRRPRRLPYPPKLPTPNPEKGLINIPATIRIPPKIPVVDLVDKDAGPSSSHSAGTSPILHNRLFGGSLAEDDVMTSKRKRARRSNTDDEDEWLPPESKTSGKRGVRYIEVLSSDDDDDDDDDQEADDEIGNPRKNNPQKDNPQKDNPDVSAGKFKLRNVINPNGEHPLSDASSLLVDWSFFKSLRPFLKKMNSAQRDDLKTFILDTLNNKIYHENLSPLT